MEKARIEEAAQQRVLELEKLRKEYEDWKDKFKEKDDELQAYLFAEKETEEVWMYYIIFCS